MTPKELDKLQLQYNVQVYYDRVEAIATQILGDYPTTRHAIEAAEELINQIDTRKQAELDKVELDCAAREKGMQ